MRALILRAKRKVTVVEQSLARIKAMGTEIDQCDRSTRKRIHVFCEQARHAWNERERKLLMEVDGIIQSKREVLSQQEDKLSSASRSINTFTRKIELAMTKDKPQALQVGRNLREHLVSLEEKLPVLDPNGSNDVIFISDPSFVTSIAYAGHLHVTSPEHSTAERGSLDLLCPGKIADYIITTHDEIGKEVVDKNCKPESIVREEKTVISCSTASSPAKPTPPKTVQPINPEISCIFVRSWGSKGEEKSQFRYPLGVAVDRGMVFVADRFNHRVQVFKDDGTFVRMWGSSGSGRGQFRNPAAVVVKNQNVCVVDTANHRIQIFHLNGTFIRMWGSSGASEGQFRNPYGMAMYNGIVYVADCGNHRVQVFQKDGTFVRMWGSSGSEEGQLSYPYAVAVDDDAVFVADRNNHRIQVFSHEGTFLRMWGKYGVGEGQFNSPEALALKGDSVYVTEYGNHRIQVFNRNGIFIRELVFNKVGQSQFNPTAVTVDGNTLYMTEAYGNCVQVFDLIDMGKTEIENINSTQKSPVKSEKLNMFPIRRNTEYRTATRTVDTEMSGGLSAHLMRAIEEATKVRCNQPNIKSESAKRNF